MPTFVPPQAEKLTDRVPLDTVIAILEHYFDLSAEGYVCQTRDLWNVLVEAAVRCSYIETVCNDLAKAPDSNTVRGYLTEQLVPKLIGDLKRHCKRAVASQLPAWLSLCAPGDDLLTVLKRLVRRVKALKIKLKRGYLDKGFCSIAGLRGWMAEPDLAIIMAAPISQ